MAKQSKKEKQEKQEFDIILEQLKKSYGSEFDKQINDSNSYVEEDEELSAMLSKIFSDSSDFQSTSPAITSESIGNPKKNSTAIISETQMSQDGTDGSNAEEVSVQVDSTETDSIREVPVEEKTIEEKSAEDSAEYLDIPPSSNAQSEQEVDDILSVMFANKNKHILSDNSISNTVDSDSQLASNASEEPISSNNNSKILDEEFSVELEEELEEELGEELGEEFDIEISVDIIDEDITENLTTAVEDEEYAVDDTTEHTNDELRPDSEKNISETEHTPSELPKSKTSANECVDYSSTPHVVLSVEEYTTDPLQEMLPLSIAVTNRKLNTNKISAIDQASNRQDSKEDIDINDISLLLKFGYDEAVKGQLGEDSTQNAILEQNSYYIPEKHKTPFGFCGKEFTDRKQIPEIEAKFRLEKRTIVARLIAVSIIAILILSSTIFFEFFSDRTSYPIILGMELFFLGLIGIIFGKKLLEGVIGIIRFEAGLYSILSLILITSIAFNIVTLICYTVNQSININTSNFMLFAFTASVYAVLALVADLINCSKEADTFQLIASSDPLFTTEKQSGKMAGSMRRKDRDGTANSDYLHSNEKAYKIRQADLISGYFKKTAMNQSGNVNLIYLLGIVPIVSLVIGCCCALFGGDIMCGVSSIMLTFLLCVPYSFLFTHSVSEYIFASHLKDHGIAFIGNESITEYSKTDTVILNDRDAVEIVSYTEIQPGKNANVKKYVSIAYKVFSVLGGTLSEISDRELSEDLKNKFNSGKHELEINEIKDNGINLYFDSSMNVLLGDKAYMREHGINVKTDVNLTTATKGPDRSVIYMAFDGSPQLGFILHSRIKKDFWSTIDLLSDENIRVFIESYEPQINDQFFESNKAQSSSDIKVHKPNEYEKPLTRRICDGRIVSTKDALGIARAIPFSRKIIEQRKRTGRIHLSLVGCGVLISCLLTLLLNVPNSMPVLGFLKEHITLLFNLCMIGGAIPAIVTLNKLYKNNRREK